MDRLTKSIARELERLTPTARQLAYLRRLAYRQHSTFVWPTTRQEAHREIERLLRERQARAKRRARRKRT